MSLEQRIKRLEITTKGEGFTDITTNINSWIEDSEVSRGLVNITSLHTSCSLTINENADRRVLNDLNEHMKAIVPEISFFSINNDKKKSFYTHKEEGIDDMPAHIKTSLTNSCLTLSIDQSKLVLGTWQAIYLWEHRYIGQIRRICLHAIGETAKQKKEESGVSNLNVISRKNPEKLNQLISQRQYPNYLDDQNDYNTELDVIIDRIHHLSDESGR